MTERAPTVVDLEARRVRRLANWVESVFSRLPQKVQKDLIQQAQEMRVHGEQEDPK